MANRWDLPLKIEHEVAKIIAQQERNGVAFDRERAVQYIEDIKEYQADIFERLRPYLSYVKDPKNRTVMVPYDKKTGELSKKAQKLFGDNPYDVSGPFTHLEINLGSRNQLIDQLLQQGWKPDLFTDKGTPKLTDGGKPVESLELLGGIGADIARWYILNHRRSVISGWLNSIRNDGRISALANPCGANTTRMKHKVVVNVPKANKDKEGNLIWDIDHQKDVFGTQMRSLFIASPGKVIVGYDASGLESRMLSHFLNDPELTELILDPDKDFHSRIWHPIEEFVHSRDNAKNVEYALIYGASDTKLGTMADYVPKGKTYAQVGKEIRRRIMEDLPALDDLTQRVQRQASRGGYVIALDGRKLWIRGEHSALNTLFQGSGAVVMKVAMLFLDKWCRQEGIDYTKLIDMHDESQAEMYMDVAEPYGELAVKSIQRAGEFLKTNCPLDGEYQIGNNWAETH